MMSTFPLLKVVLAGDDGVGKTCLSHRFCSGKFEAMQPASIGVDFQSRVIELEDNPVKLSIWDLAGQERFASVRAGFYRGSLAAGLVYDLTQPESLKDLVRWYQEISKALPGLPFLVIGNKTDLVSTPADRVGLEFAKVIRASYARTSALSGDGVEDAFIQLARLAVNRMEASSDQGSKG